MRLVWEVLFRDCDGPTIFGHDLCTPEELLKNGLGLLLAPSLILTLILLLAFIKSWVDFGRFSIRSGLRGVRGLRVATSTVRRMSTRNVAAAAAMILVVLAIQALWIVLAYYVGNSIRIFIESVMETLDPPPQGVQDIPRLLRSDTYSNWAIIVSCVGAVSSWVLQRDQIGRMIVLFSIPGGLWAVFGLIGGVLNAAYLALVTATDGTSDLDVPKVAYMFAFGVSGYLYVLSTNLALRAPKSLAFATSED
jgi:hypothetical protein